MRQFKRSARMNSFLQEEIAEIISTRLKDPRVGFTSVTRVEVTEDLRSAKVYVSVLEEGKFAETLAALQHSAGLIRGELRHRMRARRVPDLRFLEDRSIAYSIHMSEVLDRLRREREEKGPDE